VKLRAITVLTSSLLLAALPAVAIAAASTGQVWVTGGHDCRHERYKPKQILIACGDGSETLKDLAWSSWTGSKATGRGTEYRNTCNPSCSAGQFTPYPITITLTKPISCPGQRHNVFSRAVITFGKVRPGKRATEIDRLSCPF
jgi:hypothetical protein